MAVKSMLNHDAAKDWVRFGESDPYYGVLSNPSYHGRELDADVKRKFFLSGERHVDLLLKVIEEDFGCFATGKVLDFGCGVGRISQALAGKFDEVVGLDVAPGMLAEARRNADAAGIANIDYRNSLDPGSIEPHRYDLVHSYIVLQHIPVATGMPIIERLIEAVAPGGIGALHMTITPARGRLGASLSNQVKRNRLLRIVGNVARRRRWNNPVMEMNLYQVERIIDMLARSGIERFHCVHVDDWGSVGLFILFRRDEGSASKSPWSNPVRPRG